MPAACRAAASSTTQTRQRRGIGASLLREPLAKLQARRDPSAAGRIVVGRPGEAMAIGAARRSLSCRERMAARRSGEDRGGEGL